MLELEIDRKQLASLLDLGDRLTPGVLRAMSRIMDFAERTAVRNVSGRVLRIRTGTLRGDIHSEVKKDGGEIMGSLYVGDKAWYAKFHERGTSHLKKSPFLEPAVVRNMTMFLGYVGEELEREFRKL